MIATMTVDPLAFFVGAKLLLFVRRQALGIPMHFGTRGVAGFFCLDDDFVLGSVGRNGNLTEFALKHVKRLFG
jgi:hypothetical protein